MNSKPLTGLALLLAASAMAADSSLVQHMHEHYALVTAVQRAVIAGDLEAVSAPARELAEHSAPAEMQPEWVPYVESMRAAARAALAATDVESAALATAELGNSCAECHTASGTSDQFDRLKKPKYDESTAAHMRRHQWAADRMWEGLIGPSARIWKQGAYLMAETALKPDQLHAEAGRDIARMERLVHGIATSATQKYDGEGRVYSYSQLLATCAGCHVTLGLGPSP